MSREKLITWVGILLVLTFLPGPLFANCDNDLATDDTFEPNDRSWSAGVISFDNYTDLKCLDSDWYKLVVDYAVNFTVHIASPCYDGDIELELYNNPSNGPITQSTTWSNEETITWNNQTPGTEFYIHVYPWDDNARSNYTLSVSYEPPNNTHIFLGADSTWYESVDQAVAAGTTIVWPVVNTNNPPLLETIGEKSIAQGAMLEFTITATDPDGDPLTYIAGDLPPGASFDPNTRTFSWTPGPGEADSNHHIIFTVTDDGTPPLSDSETVSITVGSVNRPPVFTPPGNFTTTENQPLTFTITAADPDGDALTYIAGDLPPGASFDPNTRTFSWTPGQEDSESNYHVVFTVTDNGIPPLSDSETVLITVGEVNRPPVFNTIGTLTVMENQSIEFIITARDPDGDELTYTAKNLPIGAFFDPNKQIFTWTPTYDHSGNTTVEFTVHDDGIPSLSATEKVTISVGHVNRPPTLIPLGNLKVQVGRPLVFLVSGKDSDSDNLTYSVESDIREEVFDPVERKFTWTPTDQDVGLHVLNITVVDDGVPPLSDHIVVQISVEKEDTRKPADEPIEITSKGGSGGCFLSIL